MFTVRWPSLLPQHFGKRAGKICRAGYKKKNNMQKEKHILTIHFENEFVPL